MDGTARLIVIATCPRSPSVLSWRYYERRRGTMPEPSEQPQEPTNAFLRAGDAMTKTGNAMSKGGCAITSGCFSLIGLAIIILILVVVFTAH
jgi:hypothetical protein